MKKNYFMMLAFALLTNFLSCSNGDKFELLFQLGDDIEKVMEDDLISSKVALSRFMPEYEVKIALSKNYVLDEDGDGAIHKEDNLGSIEDLEDVTCLFVKNYTKDGVLYNKVLLFFKNSKLIQVYAETKGDDNISLVNLRTAKFGEAKERIFEQTYYDNGETSTHTYNALQYKSGSVYFEIQKDKDYRTYYTYYTKKVLPLFAVDY